VSDDNVLRGGGQRWADSVLSRLDWYDDYDDHCVYDIDDDNNDGANDHDDAPSDYDHDEAQEKDHDQMCVQEEQEVVQRSHGGQSEVSVRLQAHLTPRPAPPLVRVNGAR
jgi:hypothetical protein